MTITVPIERITSKICLIRGQKVMRPLKNGNFCSSSRKANISTTVIYLIFRGLKFEPDAEIGQKVPFCKGLMMLDRDLVALYEVETSQLKRSVRRNVERFPKDFMLDLTKDEWSDLRCQFGTSSWGGVRYMPMAL